MKIKLFLLFLLFSCSLNAQLLPSADVTFNVFETWLAENNILKTKVSEKNAVTKIKVMTTDNPNEPYTFVEIFSSALGGKSVMVVKTVEKEVKEEHTIYLVEGEVFGSRKQALFILGYFKGELTAYIHFSSNGDGAYYFKN